MPLAGLGGVAVNMLDHWWNVGAFPQPAYANEIINADKRATQIGVFGMAR